MTPADVAKVLTKIAAYDQRTIGAGDVAAWHEILAPYPLGEALQAVTRHHRDNPDRIKPAHVVAHIKAIHAEAARATSEALALPGKYEPDAARDARKGPGIAACREAVAELAEKWAMQRVLDQGELTPAEQRRQRAIKRAKAERRGTWPPPAA